MRKPPAIDTGEREPEQDSRWRNDPWALLAAVLVLCAYIGIAWFMPKHVFWSPDEGGRFLQVGSIHWDGGIHFVLPYQGQSRDPSLRFYPRGEPDRPFLTFPQRGSDGSIRFHWPLGFSMLVWPLERLLGFPGLYVVPLLSGWLICVLCSVLAGRIDARLRAPAMVLAGLATPLCFYSQTFWDHTLASLCAMAAAVLVVLRPFTPSCIVAAALALSLAAALRFEMLAFVAAATFTWLMAWLVEYRSRLAQGWPPRSMLRLVVVGTLLVAAGSTLFVASLSPRHRAMLRMVPSMAALQRRLPNLSTGARQLLVSSAASEGPATTRAADNAVLAAVFLAGIAAWIRRAWASAVFVAAVAVLLVYSFWLLWLPQGYRALHGLLPIAPFVLFAAAVVPPWAQPRSRAALLLVILTLAYLALGLGVNFVAYSDPSTGELWNTLEWGPRYVLTVYPLLAVLSLLGIHRLWRSSQPAMVRWAALAVAAGTVWVATQYQIRGLRMLHSGRQLFASWDAALPRDVPVIVDQWWLLTTLANYYLRHEVYYVAHRGQLEEWVEHIAGRGSLEFEFASLTAVDLSSFGEHARRLRVREVRRISGVVLTRLQLAAG